MIRWTVLVLVVVFAAAFVWMTGAMLPESVGSHFGANGQANGFAPRGEYTALMVGMVVAMPLLVGFGGTLLGVLPSRLVNLPNKDHWLAPERRDETIAAFGGHVIAFACALAVFLCYVHWLVVEANRASPPRLDETRFIAGLVLFVAFAVAWTVAFYLRFRRPARR